MRVRIEIDAGEREAVFVREPLIVHLSDRPEAVLIGELVGAYMEAREWLERGKPAPAPAGGQEPT